MTLPPGEPAAGPWRVTTVDELVALVLGQCGSTPGRPAVVAIDGRSAGGKSTLAKSLAAATRAPVVHTDDIAWNHSFFGWSELLAEGVLEPARAGRAVAYRPPAWCEHGREGAVTVPAGACLVIVEGVGAGRRELAGLLDAVLWVQSDSDTAQQRGIRRDSAPGMGRDRVEATRFWHEWMAQELPFLAGQRPWERACAIVWGTPPSAPEPELLLVAAPPDAAPPSLREGGGGCST